MLHPETEPAVEFTPVRRLIAAGSALLDRLRAAQSTRLPRWLGIAVNGMLVLLLGIIVYKNRDDLPLIEQLLDPRVIGLCLLLYLSSFLVQFAVWTDLLGYGRGERRGALEDYIRTTFMGRLPGGLWKLVGRMTIYRAPRLSSRTILAINLVELLLLLIANGMALLAFSALPAWMRLAGLTVLLLTLLLLASRSARFIPSLQQRHKLLRALAWGGGYLISWVCGGLIIYLILTPFSASAITFQRAIGLWCISGAIGLLLQVLPLSMLFRDATLVTLLQPIMPLHRAIVAAFAVRVVMMVCELISGWSLIGVTQLIGRSAPRGKSQALAPEDRPVREKK